MVTWSDLRVPSAIATGCVFVASSLVHMVFRWHMPDYRKLANEDEVQAALRRGSPTPGQYVIPHCTDPKAASEPAMAKKFTDGPLAMIYVGPTGMPKMGPALGGWVVYSFLVSLCAGYVGKAALGAGAAYLEVFQVIGATAFLAYAGQSASDSIWKHKPWSVTFRSAVDGLLYAALTAGSFAWRWPAA